MEKTQLVQTQWFLHFLQGPLCPICVTQSRVSVHGHYYYVNGCQIQWLRRQDIGSQPPNLRAIFPSHQEAKRTLKRWEALGSTPSHSPSWSLARKPLSLGHPNTRHCLGIHVTLTEETCAAPPTPHTWMVPLVEDMLCYVRTGLTEAVVMGLSRAVLFYGRQSMGESLSLSEARGAASTLTGARHMGW